MNGFRMQPTVGEVHPSMTRAHSALSITWASWYYKCKARATRTEKVRVNQKRTVNLRRLGKSRHRYWVHAFIVGLALTSEIHLFSVEILHHHEISASICSVALEGATQLHASQDNSPFCPLCQVARSNAVRPAAQTLLWKPYRETSYSLTTYEARYSLNLAQTLVARSPPLS